MFGAAVGATNTNIVVGAPGNDDGVGEAYEFQGDTTQSDFGDLLLDISNPDRQAGSRFGAAVAGIPAISRTSSRASAWLSLTPFSMTYSNVIRRALEAPG